MPFTLTRRSKKNGGSGASEAANVTGAYLSSVEKPPPVVENFYVNQTVPAVTYSTQYTSTTYPQETYQYVVPARQVVQPVGNAIQVHAYPTIPGPLPETASAPNLSAPATPVFDGTSDVDSRHPHKNTSPALGPSRIESRSSPALLRPSPDTGSDNSMLPESPSGHTASMKEPGTYNHPCSCACVGAGTPATVLCSTRREERVATAPAAAVPSTTCSQQGWYHQHHYHHHHHHHCHPQHRRHCGAATPYSPTLGGCAPHLHATRYPSSKVCGVHAHQRHPHHHHHFPSQQSCTDCEGGGRPCNGVAWQQSRAWEEVHRCPPVQQYPPAGGRCCYHSGHGNGGPSRLTWSSGA